MKTHYILIAFLIFMVVSCKWEKAGNRTSELTGSDTPAANDETPMVSPTKTVTTPLLLTDTLHYNLAKIDNELSAIYDSLSVSPYGSSAEKYLPLFKTRLIKHLKNKLTFEQPLDSLNKRINIRRLNGINIYSFDDMTGGSMRYDVTYVQYMGAANAVQVEELPDEGLITDAWPFIFRGKNYFLLLSRSICGNSCGTVNLRIFKKGKDHLIQTGNLFPTESFEIKNKYWKQGESLNGVLAKAVFRIHKYGEVVTYDMENLRFDVNSNIVSYDAFAFGDNGIYKTGKRIAWALKPRP